jgi:phosphohistidine phosphatase
MEIYILRHAPAAKRGGVKYPNDDRPLSKEGVEKLKLSAKGIGVVIGSVDLILTSPLIRAADTASVAAKAMRYKHKILNCEELLPDRPVNDILQYLRKLKQDAKVLLVGHEPVLSLTASALLGSATPIIELKKGAVCRIHVSDLSLKEHGLLVWHLAPRHLRSLSQ